MGLLREGGHCAACHPAPNRVYRRLLHSTRLGVLGEGGVPSVPSAVVLSILKMAHASVGQQVERWREERVCPGSGVFKLALAKWALQRAVGW